MRSCCTKHAKGFCLYMKSAIHDEICLDDDLVSHHPKISECCRSLGSQRASCTQGASEKFQASLDISSLWPVDDQCRMSHDHPEKIHNRVLWQIARRSLRSPVDQVMSMGSDYLHKLNACCEVHEADGKQKCYQKSVEEYNHLLAEADRNVGHWCEVYNAIGQDKLERKLIMMITLKMPTANFEQADMVASHYAAIAKKCCSSGGHTDCFMHESNDQPNAIPAIVNCCVQGGNARFRCLYSLLNSPSSGGDGQGGEGGAGGAGGAGGHEVEVCSRAVCEVHDKEGFGYSRR
ncbi:serum albumin SDS-1-like [Lampetra fluviatilis]